MRLTKVQPFITRFAPSPNGYLHLGHAYSALTADAAARKAGGTMLLRIDDIDTSRAREEFTQAIFEDLHWLGLDWPEPVRFQSEHMDAYEAAANDLLNLGVTYPCFCTRKTLQLDENGGYDGSCRGLSQARINAKIAQGLQPAIRLDTGKCAHKHLSYIDNEQQVTVEAAALDDPIIARKDIGASYLLSCVVDDAAQSISHVIRGIDIQPLTPLQVVLQSLLGLPTPMYQHHGLITDETQAKLSKSKGSLSLREARAAGATADAIRAQLDFSAA